MECAMLCVMDSGMLGEMQCAMLGAIPDKSLPVIPVDRQGDAYFAILSIRVDENLSRERAVERGDHINNLPAGTRFVRLSLTQ